MTWYDDVSMRCHMAVTHGMLMCLEGDVVGDTRYMLMCQGGDTWHGDVLGQ